MTIDFEKMAKGFTKTAKERGMCVGWWIPVSEMLPDKEGSYLVTAQPTYNYAKDIRIVHWGGRWVGYNQSEIIAWMPLPEPYREDGEMNDE